MNMIVDHQIKKIEQAIQDAKIRVIGYNDITNVAHAKFVQALIKAYGDEANGVIYNEPVLLTGDLAPDVVLIHPETGVIVFEVKAYSITFVQGIDGGNLKIKFNGEEQSVNPLRQAQRSMYAIKDSYERLAEDNPRPLFSSMVVLPNIREAQWMKKGYDASIQNRLIIFAEDCRDIERLRSRIGRLVKQSQNLANLPSPLPAESAEAVFRSFGHSALLDKPQRKIRALDVENLGAEIDQLEAETKKLSAEQQQLIRLDTWGHPFLLRGVAGSGKSLVLAHHVAWAVFRHEQKHNQLALFPEDRHPLPKFVVLCLNRPMIPQLVQNIQEAYFQIAFKELPAGVVTVNALNSFIFQLTQEHDHFYYIPVTKTKNPGERSRQFLAQLDAMRPADLDKLRVDALYLDEGQDVHPDTLALLHTLVRPDKTTKERTISIFYDDAQNIYGHPRPTWRTFGMNVEGGRAAFMGTCYRNSREIVELGLNVLLGTTADEKTRVHTRRFADIYTLKEKGLVEDTLLGWNVLYAKPSNVHPQVKVFPHRAAQNEWIAAAAVNLIQEEHVRPEDVLILAFKSTSFESLEQQIRQQSEGKIPLRLVGGRNRHTLDETLLMPGKLTISTIAMSKGYDAPIVILIDTDELSVNETGRALFYVGVTRAKRYLLVLGVKSAGSLLDEAAAVLRLRAATG